ncbi:hypothetical protein H0176_26680, partial [Methylorubrum populi]|nr:hypothetical protein [Methylorubrum rhodesianum]MBY0143816.1 hypothetical protein [Methylorubrum populi]
MSRERPIGDKRGGRRRALALALLPGLLVPLIAPPALAQETPDPTPSEPAPARAPGPASASPSRVTEPATAGRARRPVFDAPTALRGSGAFSTAPLGGDPAGNPASAASGEEEPTVARLPRFRT